MSALLLSDLHLPPAPSPLRDAFLRFLHGPAQQAASVYLLGDLFDYWVGDDVGLGLYAAEVAALRRLGQRGVAVHALHGNRDFLLGRAFAQACALTLLDDPWVGTLGGVRTLLSHGDLFCTDDRGYQRWRRFSRSPLAQRLFLALPRQRRERIARGLRRSSTAHQHRLGMEIIDASPQAARAAFARYGVARIIHGHTHRPAVHVENGCERIVLADWRPGHCEYLRVDAAGYERLTVA